MNDADAELLVFCDEAIRSAEDPEYHGPCAEWDDERMERVTLMAVRAARESVALRGMVDRANTLYGESCDEKTKLDAENAALRADVARLRYALVWVRENLPHAAVASVVVDSIIDAALAATEPKTGSAG